jgi:ATP-dependent helicase HepA
MPHSFRPGQRWISTSEPELGLGVIKAVADRTLTLHFGASGERRQYSREQAPLQRVRFRAGDEIGGRDGISKVVQWIRETDGLLVYGGEDWELAETELSDTISFDKPETRLLAGQCDPPAAFDLRIAALKQQHRRRTSKVRGFAGGRIELIPHQLAIAAEVADRLAPRVLLADEVGLGKTIEACLILHRLWATGRVRRALILVPDALVHQWFVELLRRFNLWAAIYDEARCADSESPDRNPFLEDQLVICSLDFLAKDGPRLDQALAAGWDLLVVDEAHHLGWTPEAASPEYQAVEKLGMQTPGLLLLTATPEQLGMAGHFARLRLLDPDRFGDLESFIRETEQYRAIARWADSLLRREPLQPEQQRALAQLLSQSESELQALLEDPSESSREALIAALVDRHGTGRVMFRNTRATIQGFPPRMARLAPLEAEILAPFLKEWIQDDSGGGRMDLTRDVRVAWLAELLLELEDAKVLVICRTRAKAEALEAALKTRISPKMALFHEGMTLVQRDRGAAWFNEPQGARLLICSEIGSEGRNFQTAHHLVLFDLPKDPALLEQRIGRLDRIGQTSAIQIHIPVVNGTPQSVLARWYHEALNAFESQVQGAGELLERFGHRIQSLGLHTEAKEVEALLRETREAHLAIRTRLMEGHDRLLELNTGHPERANRLAQAIRAQDEDRTLDEFLLSVLEHSGIEVEQVAARTYRLGSAGVLVDAFPGLPTDGITLTCDRARALAREDLPFLTWDHPLVSGALDVVLGAEKGNSSFALWPDRSASGLYLEAIYVLEAIAPSHLHVDRFLPPTPLRVLIDHQRKDLSRTLPRSAYLRHLQEAESHALLDQPGFRETLLPRMIASAHRLAERRVPELVSLARKAMALQLQQEEARLRALQRVNPAVRTAEIALLVTQRQELDQHLAGARLRLDALRVIHRGEVSAPDSDA